MVSKMFQQNGRQMHQRGVGGARGAGSPFKKHFKPQGVGVVPTANNFSHMMFNASQIPDNQGYVDFNNPTPPIIGGAQIQTPAQPKKKNKNKQKNKQPPQQTVGAVQNFNNNVPQPGRGGRFNGGRGFGPGRGRRMMPPPGIGMNGPRGVPMPPPHVFQPPMIPPMLPMGRGIPQPMGGGPPPFLRRSGRNGPMPPPSAMPPMMPPRMQRGRLPPPVPFNGAGKVKKGNVKTPKKMGKGKNTIKTLKNLVNQYPLDKPWVTDTIRAEFNKKVDIENRLKGNKDDDLFAQFKVQRDLFVSQYETAREEYLKKEAEAVKVKDAKDKQTINKTAAMDGNSQEAIQNTKG